MTFRPVPSGTEVTCATKFTFKGASRFAILLLKPAFERLGDEAEARHAHGVEPTLTGPHPASVLISTPAGRDHYLPRRSLPARWGLLLHLARLATAPYGPRTRTARRARPSATSYLRSAR